MSFKQFFSYITMESGCNKELTHFYSAASLRYHIPATWHDTISSYIILTMGQQFLAQHENLNAMSTALYHFLQLWYVTSWDRTWYILISEQIFSYCATGIFCKEMILYDLSRMLFQVLHTTNVMGTHQMCLGQDLQTWGRLFEINDVFS